MLAHPAQKMPAPSCSCSHIKGLLVWTVLTASTIGPGTVMMCSMAGAEYQEKLFWCVLVAAMVAWIMQEGSGRLTILTGKSLGMAVRALTPRSSGWPYVCRHLLALFCAIGNMGYEMNNFAGTMAAVEIMLEPPQLQIPVDTPAWASPPPPHMRQAVGNCTSGGDGGGGDHHGAHALPEQLVGTRQLINFALAPVCVGCMLAGSAQRVGLVLSVVVAAMVACFGGALSGTGVPHTLLFGLVPRIPEGAAEVALALMGTTAIPVNLLLGSSLAKQSSMHSMRQGVGLASALSGLISVLVLLVGAQVPPRPPCVPFSLREVALVLRRVMGPIGFWGFGVGLFGAGLSSALTIPLGMALTLEDLYGLLEEEEEGEDEDAAGEAVGAAFTPPGGGWVPSRRSIKRRWRSCGRALFMSLFLLIGLIPSLLRMPTVTIITAAQVANGVLLPVVASVLLLSLNHSGFMASAGGAQPMLNTLLMLPCVAIAMLLASMVLMKQTIGRAFGADGGRVAMTAAVPCAAAATLLLVSRVRVVRRAAGAGLRRANMNILSISPARPPLRDGDGSREVQLEEQRPAEPRSAECIRGSQCSACQQHAAQMDRTELDSHASRARCGRQRGGSRRTLGLSEVTLREPPC